MGAFIIGEVLVRVYEEEYLVWTRAVFAFQLSVLPIFNSWNRRRFYTTLRPLCLLTREAASCDGWLRDQNWRIFTQRTWLAKLVTWAIVLAALATVFSLGIPLQSPVPTFVAVAGFAGFLLVCGQTLYTSLALLRALIEVSRREVEIPFLFLPHPAISRLQGYYLTQAASISALYILFILAAATSPYGIYETGVSVWLLFLATYPLLMFAVSVYCIHVLIRDAKEHHLEQVNQQVRRAFAAASEATGDEADPWLERLEKYVGVQESIRGVREWPVDLAGALTLILTLATTLAQVAVLFR